jgi:DNA-binding CsgD family transcriptional regulator
VPSSTDSRSTPPSLERLTPRERECLRLVAQHLSSKEIARRLGLSQHTVDGHLHEARRKLGVPTRRDAVRILLESEGGESPPPNWGGQSAAQVPSAHGASSGGPPPVLGGQPTSVAAAPTLASTWPSASRSNDDHDPHFIPADGARPGAAAAGTGSVRGLLRHELTPPQRLAAIVVIAAVSALVLTLLLLGAHELTFLIQRMTEGG